jgi:hypothetical protein
MECDRARDKTSLFLSPSTLKKNHHYHTRKKLQTKTKGRREQNTESRTPRAEPREERTDRRRPRGEDREEKTERSGPRGADREERTDNQPPSADYRLDGGLTSRLFDVKRQPAVKGRKHIPGTTFKPLYFRSKFPNQLILLMQPDFCLLILTFGHF